MNDESLHKLIEGYREFHKQYVDEQYAEYRLWAGREQKPKVMIIACSDSRVNPAILTHAGLGEIFTVNNVANLVPPYKEGKDTHHSTSAALEFAINHLRVENIIILGHSNCGGIKALMHGETYTKYGVYSFIKPWMDIAHEAKERVIDNYPDCSLGEKIAHCEKEALLVSLENLKTFPWVQSALNSKAINIHAWYFNVETGGLEQYSPKENIFIPLIDLDSEAT